MSEAITFEVKGLKELERELLQLPDKIARRSLARAAAAGARMVRDKARENARAIGLVDKGRLVKSIRVKKKKTRDWRTTQIYGIGHGGKGWYGRLYEYGFKTPVGERKHRPHIRPALDENAEQVAQAVKDRLDAEIRQIQAHGIARPK